MLPSQQILMWQRLFTHLSDLPSDSMPELKVSLRQTIEFFESEILDRDLELSEPLAGKMRSYLTESYRLLRLLPMDAMFIAAARNPTTLEQRRQAYQEKLTLSIEYCQAAIACLQS